MTEEAQPSVPAPATDPKAISFGSSADTAGDSLTVAAWTVISRVTGVAKIAAIGAVLGPTFFGNTFQFTNSLPNLVYYGFLAGSLFSSLLVPALVRHIDAGDGSASERVAGGFLGMTLVALAVLTPVVVALGPLLLRVAAPGRVGAAQERVGFLLIIMFVPQVFFYAVIGTATAVMNASRRFALAAAAPALENVGIIAVLVATTWIFGSESSLEHVPTGELLLLGLGTTGAVALHAVTQWWGARRAGVLLVPRAGWRNAEVRVVIRRTMPSLAQASLYVIQLLAILLVVNRVPGGVVAFQIGLNFYTLAVAIGATPVALSLLPRLARIHVQGDMALFRDTMVRGFALGLFVTVPAAVGLLTLAAPLARAVSFGRMGSATGVAMVEVTIATLAMGVIAQTIFMIGMYASYARKDTRSPLRSMFVQAATCLALLTGALFLHGTAVVGAAGLAFSTSMIVAACHLNADVRRRAWGGSARLLPSAARIAVGAAVMAAPAWLTAIVLTHVVSGQLGDWLALFAATAVGCATFVGVQALWRTPELSWVTGGLAHMLGRGSRVVSETSNG